jgi:hypothetical protein
MPSNTLSFRDTENVAKFLKSYSKNNAILLPGRIPGYKRDDLQLLPSSTTKKVSLKGKPTTLYYGNQEKSLCLHTLYHKLIDRTIECIREY